VLTYEMVMVIIAIASILMGIVGKFFWDKLNSYDNKHTVLISRVVDIDTRLSSRMNTVENRATAIESTIVTKEDLFNIANVLREDAEKRNEKLYDKLELLTLKLEDIKYGQHMQ